MSNSFCHLLPPSVSILLPYYAPYSYCILVGPQRLNSIYYFHNQGTPFIYFSVPSLKNGIYCETFTQKNMIPYHTAWMQSTAAIVYTHSLLKGAGGVAKVLEFARGLVSADCSTILNVNYTVNGSPFLQRDMHQVHSKRKSHSLHSLFGASIQRRQFYKGAILSNTQILQFWPRPRVIK